MLYMYAETNGGSQQMRVASTKFDAREMRGLVAFDAAATYHSRVLLRTHHMTL